MISNASDDLLFVEPEKRPVRVPVVDAITRRMTGAWRKRTRIEPGFRGIHHCTSERCYTSSDNYNYLVATADGRVLTTNSLAIHYLAHHRDEVPTAELAKVAQLLADEERPTAEEMNTQTWPEESAR